MAHIKSLLYTLYIMLFVFAMLFVSTFIPKLAILGLTQTAVGIISLYVVFFSLNSLATVIVGHFPESRFALYIVLFLVYPLALFALFMIMMGGIRYTATVENLFSSYTLYSLLITVGLMLIFHFFNAALKDNIKKIVRYFLAACFIFLFVLADVLLTGAFPIVEFVEEGFLKFNGLIYSFGFLLPIYALIFSTLFEILGESSYSRPDSALSVTASIIKRL